MAKAYSDMRLGLFVHYAFFDADRAYAGGTIGLRADGTPAESLEELADALDVENIARAAQDMRAEYVIFTAWHANMNLLFPCKAMDRYRPGHCSRRDVIAELAAALQRRGIALMLYVHPSDGHDFSQARQDALGWNDPAPYRRWNDFINDVFAETVARYRSQAIGYWVDGSLPPQVDGAIDRLRETIRTADPQAVVVQNEAFDNNFFRRWADFSCREAVRDPFPCEAMAAANVITRTWWATGAPLTVTPEVALQYTVLQAAVTGTEGGGVSWAAGPYSEGRWEPGVREFFRTLGRYVDSIAPALFDTRPSRSFLTQPKVDLFWHLKDPPATESLDGKTTYIHVLKPPTTRELILPPPADGKLFRHACLLENSRPVTVAQDASNLRLALADSEAWQDLDTVIVLT